MRASVLIIGVGDAGSKMAAGLAQSGKVDRLVLAGQCRGRGPAIAGMLASCYDCNVSFTGLDGTRQQAVEQLLKAENPDLVVQSASLLSPWAMVGRTDPVATTLAQAGLGVQLPAQLPILMSVMRAVREADFQGPVANLSFPDVSHVILDRLGFAPTIGLGNVSMQHLRVRAALREQIIRDGGSSDEMPLIRLVGHHNQVYGVMKGQAPANPDDRCQVYLGATGERADELAYQSFPMMPGIDYNVVTAAAALPVLLALLPGAETLRFSAPAPQGLPGGYPVVIEDGKVELDLPKHVPLQEAVDFHWRIGRADGIESVADDGTVVFSEQAKQAVKLIDPVLCEPLSPSDCLPRYQLLMRHLNS